MQQARHRQPGQGGVFGSFVQHGVAGQQRRDEDVAADKPGIVPGRDVRHQPERRVLDSLGHAAFVEHGLGLQQRVHFL